MHPHFTETFHQSEIAATVDVGTSSDDLIQTAPALGPGKQKRAEEVVPS